MAVPTSYIRHAMPTGTGVINARWFTWILDTHWDFQTGGRSVIGQLVYDAKYKNDSSAIGELTSVVRHSILQISKFASPPGPSGLECVIAVPSSSQPDHGSTLPRRISNTVSQVLGIPDASQKVSIARGLATAKNGAIRTPNDFSISADFVFENVLLVDDLLATGQTMLALGECLAGRRSSIRLSGFSLTKVHKGLRNW